VSKFLAPGTKNLKPKIVCHWLPQSGILTTSSFIFVAVMTPPRRPLKRVLEALGDDNFLKVLGGFEGIVAKFLSIAMLGVILASVADLGFFLFITITSDPIGRIGSGETLFQIFGLFLNVLIALEILENITAYLKRHVIHAELVIVTSLIAVSRKIIILDLEKKDAIDLVALAFAVVALSASYWIIRWVNRRSSNQDKH
jgi:uncharacterized membrane protein (DUF373 family)